MLDIDGKEGGGQLLRSALALSLCTGEPFRMEHIRAKRSRPGLMRQHLTAVQAAVDVGNATVEGAEPGSTTLTFTPRTIAGGDYHWQIGTAGSTTLVLQTVLPALWHAGAAASIRLEGGTHNPLAPSADFLIHAFLPLMQRMGLQAELALQRHGFFPAGGGALHVQLAASSKPLPLHLLERGALLDIQATALMSSIPGRVGERELAVLARGLQLSPEQLHIRDAIGSPGPGNALMVQVRHAQLCELFTNFGERGISAEAVAERVCAQTRAYLHSGAAVSTHLADQLLLPLALAGSGSFTTQTPSDHCRSNAALIEKFLPVDIAFAQESEGLWQVRVSG